MKILRSDKAALLLPPIVKYVIFCFYFRKYYYKLYSIKLRRGVMTILYSVQAFAFGLNKHAVELRLCLLRCIVVDVLAYVCVVHRLRFTYRLQYIVVLAFKTHAYLVRMRMLDDIYTLF